MSELFQNLTQIPLEMNEWVNEQMSERTNVDIALRMAISRFCFLDC